MEVLFIATVGERFDRILGLIARFTDALLDDEYKDLAFKFLRDVRKIKRGILKDGQLNIWAASVVYSIVKINYLNDKTFKPYIPYSLIFEFYGVKKATIESKVQQLQEYMDFELGDSRYATEKAQNIQQYKFDLIKAKIRKFCNEKLNEEYKFLGYKLLEKLSELDNVPFMRGSLDIWAGSIMYTLSQLNLLYNKSFEPYMPQEEIRSYFNVKSSTILKRTSEIKKMLSLEVGDWEFSTEFARENIYSFLNSNQIDESNLCEICVSDSNPVIESLGCGLQTILIRKSKPPADKFLLFPSTLKRDFEKISNFFKNKHYSFSLINFQPNMEGEYSEVKYYAEVEDVFEKPIEDLASFREFQLYTRDYYDNYFNGQNPVIWILRVYKLNVARFLKKQSGSNKMTHPISLNGEPVIKSFKYSQEKQAIIDKKWEVEKKRHIKDLKKDNTLKSIDDRLY